MSHVINLQRPFWERNATQTTNAHRIPNVLTTAPTTTAPVSVYVKSTTSPTVEHTPVQGIVLNVSSL